MTEQERLLKAKIPGPETGIEIKHSLCDICTPGPQCGLNVYVKDGKVIKIDGTPGFFGSNGKLCTKGAANRQYVCREDRIRTPMKRVGERGSKEFVPISWEEAYDIIEENLSSIRERYGADSVTWFTGFTKWIRPWLNRLCNSFGSHNYLTESSTCFTAGKMANITVFGRNVQVDFSVTPKLIVSWAGNPFFTHYPVAKKYIQAKESGTKIIVIDVRHTQAVEKLSDLYLRPKIGTDAVLAHAMANVIIQNGWQDQDFINKYVHGYAEYCQMISQYDLETAEKITGVPKEDIRTAAEWIAHAKPTAVVPNNGVVHHINGYNTHRAIVCLNLITGNFDKPGTIYPVKETFNHMVSGFATHEAEFVSETAFPQSLPRIGEERFPLWSKMMAEGQTMDFPRQVLEGKPYKIHALAAFGVNTMIFPEPSKFREALNKLDFIFATDLFWTEMCSYADVVLPVCSSIERSELKCYPAGYFYYTTPAIDPLYESKDDVEVMTELARRLCPQDNLLTQGYDACIHSIFRDNGDEIDQGKATNAPYRSALFKPYIPGSYLKNGADTPSGKLELYSELIAGIDPSYELNPLPVYYDGNGDTDPVKYPFVLMTGARLSHTIHSRGHKVPWLRSLRPEPMVDINPEDAKTLGIVQDDRVRLFNDVGEIYVKANVTEVANIGDLHFIHGYEEACASDLLSWNALDPYTGFPSYKQMRCAVEKVNES